MVSRYIMYFVTSLGNEGFFEMINKLSYPVKLNINYVYNTIMMVLYKGLQSTLFHGLMFNS